MAFHVLHQWRVREGYGASDDDAGNNGLFMVPGVGRGLLLIQASDGGGWEHVSVSVPGGKTCPAWEEMDFVKRLFWDDTDCVAQLHVPRKDWVNFHPRTLHLWRKVGEEWATPPSIFVGPKTEEIE
jgi:hypothetical protein